MKILERVEDKEEIIYENIPHARIDEDVIILGHVIDELRRNSLKALAYYYSEYGGYERKLDEYKSKTKIDNYLEIDENVLKEYAIMDAIVTRRVYDNMIKHINELDKKYENEFYPSNGMKEYYYNRCIPAANMYMLIEERGVYVSKELMDKTRDELEDYIADIKKQLSKLLNVSEDFKWDSGRELGLLLEERGWEDFGRQSAGCYSTGDFQLVRWEKTHPQECKLLQSLRTITKLANSFLGDKSVNSFTGAFLGESNSEGTKGWSQYVKYHKEDGTYRIHADYTPMGTDSGRTRCSKPNFQNVPSRVMFADKIKSCLRTPDDENYYLATIDYSNLQMRLACIDCKDPNLTELFLNPKADPHSKTGWLTFAKNKPYDMIEVQVEQDGKIYNFMGKEQVNTQRGLVFAEELEETDTIIV